MSRTAIVLVTLVALVVLAYFTVGPSLAGGLQGIHGPLGGGPGMHGR